MRIGTPNLSKKRISNWRISSCPDVCGKIKSLVRAWLKLELCTFPALNRTNAASKTFLFLKRRRRPSPNLPRKLPQDAVSRADHIMRMATHQFEIQPGLVILDLGPAIPTRGEK
jgi:hypothetical protein